MPNAGDTEADLVVGGESIAARPASGRLVLFTGTLFLSALLLFAVQPMFARLVLPRLGGSAAVWSIAMVFFQAVLLAGYAYAHLLVRYAGRWALLVHAAVTTAALAWLPIGVASGYDVPPDNGVPLWLLALFASSIGVPFFAVSANAPLLQAWFSRTTDPHAGDPYFLYGASNLGSFVALLAYPTLCEPFLPLSGQGRVWAAGFLILFAGIVACGLLANAARRDVTVATASPDEASAGSGLWRQRLHWMAFACIPSALLVATTAHLSTDIAAAPFLWVMPLAVFLLTFVIAFGRQELIPARWVQLLVPIVAIAAVLPLSWNGFSLGALPVIAINLLALFVIALAWHTELVRQRPPTARLTEFLPLHVGGRRYRSRIHQPSGSAPVLRRDGISAAPGGGAACDT